MGVSALMLNFGTPESLIKMSFVENTHRTAGRESGVQLESIPEILEKKKNSAIAEFQEDQE